MSVLNWVHSGEVVALGWTLLHFCWQSAIIALLYALVDRCLFRATTAVRYGVAMTMLGLMPLAAIATFIEQERLVVHLDQGEQTFVASQIGSLHTTIAMEAPFVAPAMADSELWIAGHADRLGPGFGTHRLHHLHQEHPLWQLLQEQQHKACHRGVSGFSRRRVTRSG